MFRAVTKYAGKFKALFEVLFQNMTTVCFTINKEGMFLEHLTTQNLVISVFLPADNFEEYIFDYDEPIHIGLGSHINKEFFKYVKNKDIVTFSITKEFVFDFEKKSEIDDCVQSLAVSIENIQNITPINHGEYQSTSVKISSINFNQMCRSFNSPMLNVTRTNGQISFSFETGISTKSLIFGKENLTDTRLSHQTYYSDQFSRISKISSFISEPIEVYAEELLPLYLHCTSFIGYMKVFISPRNLDQEN
jgi:hypothetical protein